MIYNMISHIFYSEIKDDTSRQKRKQSQTKYMAAIIEELKDNSPSKAKKSKRTARRKKTGGKQGRGVRNGKDAGVDELDDKSQMKSLVNQIARLTRSLPKSILEGVSDGKIAVSLDEDGESGWAVFNKFFDRTFGKDTRNSSGRLQHLTQGDYGMDFVNCYLVTVVDKHLDNTEFPVDLAIGKLTRLRDELCVLAGVSDQDDGLEVGGTLDDEDDEDGDYLYRSHARSPSVEVGDIIYDSNGEEIVDEHEPGPSSRRSQSDSEEEVLDRKGKGKAKSRVVLSDSEEEERGGNRKKARVQEKGKAVASKSISHRSSKVCS